jgi:MATE family multidrug resistance protein
VKLVAAVAAVVTTVFLLFKNHIPYLFTSDSTLVSEVIKTLPLYIIYQFFDYIQGTSTGIIRGMGKQFYASITNIVSCYFVALPLGIFFAFTMGFGLQGLWMGMAVNVMIQATIY